jgi:hypothetical protein
MQLLQQQQGLVIDAEQAAAFAVQPSAGVQQQQQQQLCIAAGVEQAAAFAVHPSAGVLQAGEEREFILEFAPPAVAEHAAAALLLVERSGDAWMTLMCPTAARKSRSSCSSSNAGAAAECSRAGAAAAAAVEAAVEAAVAAASPAASDSCWESVVTLGLEGLGVPICLAVEPCAVVTLPGQLTVGEVGQQLLVLRNDSPAAAQFSIESLTSYSQQYSSSSSSSKKRSKQQQQQQHSAVAVQFVPSSGTVPSCGSIQLSVNFTGLAAGVHTEQLLCNVTHGPSLALSAKAGAVEAAVVPAQAVLDFGVICIGSSSMQQLLLCNAAGSCSTAWRLQQIDPEVRSIMQRCVELNNAALLAARVREH